MPTGLHTEVLVDEERACPECGSGHLVRDYRRGEIVCDACGLIVSPVLIDDGPEWTAFSMEENQRASRTGAPYNRASGATGLTTVIRLSSKDARGNTIPLGERHKFHRMRTLQYHSSHSRPGERSLPETIRTLERVSAIMSLPRTVKAEAGFLCRKALEKRFAQGRSIERIVAAAVYAACRIYKVPRTLDELQKVTGVSKKMIGRTYNALLRTLTLRVPSSRPADYVGRFCSELGLSNDVQAQALKILEDLEETDMTMSLSPMGITAAAIYVASLVCEERRPQKIISKVAGVSEVTLRNRFPLVKEYMQQLTLPRGRAPKLPSRQGRARGQDGTRGGGEA